MNKQFCRCRYCFSPQLTDFNTKTQLEISNRDKITAVLFVGGTTAHQQWYNIYNRFASLSPVVLSAHSAVFDSSFMRLYRCGYVDSFFARSTKVQPNLRHLHESARKLSWNYGHFNGIVYSNEFFIFLRRNHLVWWKRIGKMFCLYYFRCTNH